MPVEIKELHIKISVNAPQAEQNTGAGRPVAANSNAGESNQNQREAIVAECVEQVLQILYNKKER